MIIRKSKKEDARNIGILHYHCWQDTYRGLIDDAFLDGMSEESSADKKEAQFDLYGKYWYVAEEENNIIGFISVHPSNEKDANYEVEALYLDKNYHHKGYGKQMFSFIKELFNNEPFYLWCLKTNPTLGFYQHMGGTIVDTKCEAVGEEVCLLFE